MVMVVLGDVGHYALGILGPISLDIIKGTLGHLLPWWWFLRGES